MRGKGVKHGFNSALRTPYFYMSNKEKKNLNGEVKVYKMHETIIPMKELVLKSEDVQKEMLARWRELYTNDKIVAELGCTNTIYYDLAKKLNLTKKYKKSDTETAKKKGKAKAVASVAISSKPTLLDMEVEPIELKVTKQEIESEVVKQMIVSKGLHLEYNGRYDVEALTKLFTKLQLLIDGDTNKYNISLSLTEIEED